MNLRSCTMAAMLMGLLCSPKPTLALQYDIHEIGAFYCLVTDMNDAGQFTGVATGTGITRFDIYGNKTVYSANGWGNGINNAGQIASGMALDINNKGQTCGIGSSYAGYFYDATSNRTYSISSPDNAGYVQPYALNDNGLVAGVVVAPKGNLQRAFRWSVESGFQYLPELGPSSLDYTRGINSQGWIAGGSSFGQPGYKHAVLWDPAGNIIDLTPDSYADCHDINDAGYAVGWRGNNSTPVVWTPGREVIYLPKLAGANICEPYAINNKGIIVGRCYMPATAESRMVYWTPVPEPAGIMVLLSGLTFAAALARRRAH